MGTPTTAEEFKTVMAQVPAAVCVVTTTAENHHRHGTTVSSFMSLSMNPPMFVVSLGNDSVLLTQLTIDSLVGINVLAVDQADVAAQFAQKDKNGLIGADWEVTDGQPPLLPGSHARMICIVAEFVRIGDHTLVVGTVESTQVTPGAPLLYWQRTYGTHSAA